MKNRFCSFARPAAAALIAVALLTGCFGGGAGTRRVEKAATNPQYANSLHTRFYEAWRQPAAVNLPRGRVSIPVDVRIDGEGRVIGFTLAKSSGNDRLDASIKSVGNRIKRVPPPPGALPAGHFDLRIYFELDVKE